MQVLLWKKLNVTVPVNASPSPAVICAVSYRFELIGITVLLATVASLALFLNDVEVDGVVTWILLWNSHDAFVVPAVVVVTTGTAVLLLNGQLSVLTPWSKAYPDTVDSVMW